MTAVRRLIRESHVCCNLTIGYRPRPRKGFIYFLLDPAMRIVKIGFTGNVESRVQAIAATHFNPLTLVVAISGTLHEETLIHRHLRPLRVRNEWYRYAGECKALVREVVEEARG